jgi:glycosidase
LGDGPFSPGPFSLSRSEGTITLHSSLPQPTCDIIRDIYGSVPDELAAGIAELLECTPAPAAPREQLWDEQDVVLITYADQIRQRGQVPIDTLRRFLLDHGWHDVLRCVHLLPFCPSTSDDGFSVVDYMSVDPEVGGWGDVEALGKHFDLMFDLVLNHSSRQHRWFQRYLQDDPDYAHFYLQVDPAADLSSVVRPRSLPLLTEFSSATGTRHVWTTFSDDQVDLNYANPRVLLAMLHTLVAYARRGARIVRLDAIAYLWKELGTPCIHLPQTHAIVRLMRDLLDRVAPGTLLLTETNVPHPENIGYFGNGANEAHMVYQFSLPPLLLDAIHSGDTSILSDWIAGLHPPSTSATFFNFTASHDGVGVRPLEGLVPEARVERLVNTVQQHGGLVSTRRMPSGADKPYELNITYLDAVADRNRVSAAEHARRFLSTQAIMLALQGIPAIYFHSLVGSANDRSAAEASGQPRRINRHKYCRDELETAIAAPDSLPSRVSRGFRRLLEIRRTLPAFHPSAPQRSVDMLGHGVVGFWRAPDSADRLLVLANLNSEPKMVRSHRLHGITSDRLVGESFEPGEPVSLSPYQVRWMTG